MFGSFETSLIAIFEQLYRTLGYGGVVGAMAIESACIPLPSEIILPMAGWMVSRQVFSLWGATIAGVVGCLIGSSVAYWVGALGGRPLLDRYGRYLLISHHDLDVADRWFGRYGQGAIFFSRLLPVVRTFISLPAGIARMPFGLFLLYTALGSLPWSLALVYAGKSLGDNWEALRPLFQKFDVVIVVLAVIAVALYVYRHVSHDMAPERAVGETEARR
ncbi:MAG: DedA family protein [Candidatus Dormibacteraceae bacterium]